MAKNANSEPKFVMTLRMGDKTFTGEGATALEALQAMPVPIKITNKGIMDIVYGDKKKQVLFQIMKLKRLFWPNSQPTLAKMLGMGLK